MMNWIYTWHDARKDPPAADLAQTMTEIFLSGVLAAGHRQEFADSASH